MARPPRAARPRSASPAGSPAGSPLPLGGAKAVPGKPVDREAAVRQAKRIFDSALGSFAGVVSSALDRAAGVPALAASSAAALASAAKPPAPDEIDLAAGIADDAGAVLRRLAAPSAQSTHNGSAGEADSGHDRVPCAVSKLAHGFKVARSAAATRARMLAAAGVGAEDAHGAATVTAVDADDHGTESDDNEHAAGDSDAAAAPPAKRARRRSGAVATASASEAAATGAPKASGRGGRKRAAAPAVVTAADADATADAAPDAAPDAATADVDAYFAASSSAKVASVTSDNTLASLPALTHAEYLNRLATLPPRPAELNLHASAKRVLRDAHRARFPQWALELSQGFSVLLVGYGGKHAIVHELLAYLGMDAVVVAGHAAGCSAKALLTGVTDALQLASCDKDDDGAARGSTRGGAASHVDDPALAPPAAVPEHLVLALALLTARKSPADPLVLAVHSADAPALRSEKSVAVLASLAAHPHVRLVATADHANANLLWDAAARAKLQWAVHHAATFDAYTCAPGSSAGSGGVAAAATAAPPFMVRAGTSATSPVAVATVLAALPASSRAVFAVLARAALDAARTAAGGASASPGAVDAMLASDAGAIASAALYAKCREQFLVNEEASFRTILAEFRDHHVVVARRMDGVEVLGLGLNAAGVESVLERLESM